MKLTTSGEKIALEIIRHHRLLETYLREIMGYPWETLHEEAEHLEHHISEEIEERLVGTYSAIHYSYFTNYGTPQFRYLEGLSLRASVHLTINDDYSTTGEVRLPVSLDPDNPSDEVEVLSLDGGYTILGNDTFYGPYMLNLYHSTDTALRDVWFELSPSISLNPQITPNPDHFSLSARTDWDPQLSELRFNGVALQLERTYN
ncbi:MAG: hypothetical protein OXF84_01280 [Bacteroidetes bacterium]|nr:hypothetical protein [Bacteroidota bacterium]